MKLFKKHLTLILAVFLLAVAILPVLPVVAADKGDFAAELKVGVDNKAEILRYAPFAITVENNGTDFSGKIQMILPNKVNYNLMYESDFSIAKGEKKTVTFSAKVLDNLGKVNIRIINKKGKVVWNEIKRFNVDKTASTKIDIGVLSDDFSALGYMDNIEFYDRETFKTNLVELTADDFPEDVNSLDMLEMIIISNFSTDILTDKQIEALNLWVNRGGMLVIGTGSNSSKTLSKIRGHVLNIDPDKMNRYSTTFGLNYYGSMSSTYQSTAPEDAPDPRDDEDFMEYFDDWFYNYRDDVDSFFLEDFMANQGLDESDLEDDGSLPSYYEEEYYEFCLQTMYGYQYQPQDPNYVAYSYPVATADVLVFSEDAKDANLKEILYGDNTAGEDYILARIYEKAEGYIAIYGIDFTMNPIPGYQNASEIISVLIEKYVLRKVVEHYDDVSNMGSYYQYNLGGSNYDLNNLLESFASAPMPPLLFYIIPVLGYLVAILVMYLVSRKKGKTFRLWYWYPVMAVGVAVVVFCIGFSTRIIRPRINTATVLDLQKPAAIEKNYVGVTTPSNKDCTVEFSNDYNLELMRQLSSYSDQSDKIDFNKYRVGFKKGVDRTEVTFSGNVALSSDSFVLESIYPSTRGFDVQYVVNAPGGKSFANNTIIKNETSVDLENAVVLAPENPSQPGSYSYYDMIVHSVGTWKNGETVDLTDSSVTGKMKTGYEESVAFTDADKHIFSGVFLGSLSEGFKKYKSRRNLLSYVINVAEDELRNYTNSGTPDPDDVKFIYVVGFPKEPVCKDIQFDKKYRNERTEIIIQRIDYSQMRTVKKQ